MSVTSGRAASQPFTQRRDFWVLMGYAVALGVFGAFTGLVFIGVIKAGASGTPIPIPGRSAHRLRRTAGAVQAWKLANDPRTVAGPVWHAVGVQRSGSCVTLGVGDPPLMATRTGRSARRRWRIRPR